MVVNNDKEAAKALAAVQGDKRFFCADGIICANLIELAGCLNKMSSDTFNHHTKSFNNDFSNWIRHVLGDDKLADDILKASSSQHTSKIINDRVKWLQKKAR